MRDAYGASSLSRLSLRLTYYGYFSLKVGSRPPRPAFFSGPRAYPDFIRILNLPNLHSCGLFLSIPESKHNLREKEKFRVCEEITPSKLGFVKMMGEDKNQPCPDNYRGCFVFVSKTKMKAPGRDNKSLKFILSF